MTQDLQAQNVELSASDFNAEFDVSVIYKGDTYTLQIQSKDAKGDPYGGSIKRAVGTAAAETIVQAWVADKSNWIVSVALPIGTPIKLPGGIELQKCDISVGEGTVTPPTPAPAPGP